MSEEAGRVAHLIVRALDLPEGDEQIAHCEEAARLADLYGNLRLQYLARETLVRSCVFGGAAEKALVYFSWLLAQFDLNPGVFDQWAILWKYKWIVGHVCDFPQIPKRRIYEMLDDLEARSLRAGYGLRAVTNHRYRTEKFWGDREKAAQYFYEMEALPQDGLNNCPACEMDERVGFAAFRGHTSRVNCLCLSKDASFVVSGAEDRTVRLWESFSAECVRVLEGHESTVSAVCASLDGERILSADRGGVVKLWDRATGECLLTIRAHAQHVSPVRLTGDGRFAASASHDKTVKLWNLSDGSCMKTLEHADWVTGVDLTPDGAYLVSSSYEGTKVWELVWRMEPRDLAEWDEGARPLLEMLMTANGGWAGTLGTETGMYERHISQALRRESPSWVAWHTPSKGLWHFGWDIRETLGHAGYGWLTGAGREGSKLMDEWARNRPR